MMREAISTANTLLAPYIRQTPVIQIAGADWNLDCHPTLKLETLQYTGSFKSRGAFNRILSQIVPASGVIAASGGNHGLAVAFAARRLGYRAEIFVPEV